jgi:integrase
LRLLLAILNWATRAGNGRGGNLLEKNPLSGLKVPKDESPKRAVLSDSQYSDLLGAAGRHSAQVTLLVTVVAETGHRIASVRQLRWSDIDLEGGRIRWRAENDKIGLEQLTPLTAACVVALRGARAESLRIGDSWVFPSPRNPAVCLSSHGANHVFQRLAKNVQLPKGERYGWHSMRRRFATSLRSTDPKTAMALGGWKNHVTLLLYQQTNEASQREALEGRLPVAGSAVNHGKVYQMAQ